MAPKKYRPQNIPGRSKSKMKLPHWTKSLPRKVTICGIRYSISYNLNRGCCFDCVTCKILVGCSSTKDVAVSGLIHEISEVIHVHQFNRFHNGSENGDLRFFMTHDAFERHNDELVNVLRSSGLMK